VYRYILILSNKERDATKAQGKKVMRYEIVANKGNDVVYIKTFNEIEATIKEWELRLRGYKTKLIINEK